MPGPFYTSRRSQLNQRERLCPPSSVLSHRKSQILASLHSRTTKLKAAIKSLLRKDCAMGSVRPGNGDFCDISCAEETEVGISNKRKTMTSDFQPYFDYYLSLFVTKHHKALRSLALIAHFSHKKQKLGLHNSQHNSSLNTLRIEDITEIAQLESDDSASQSIATVGNNATIPHLRESGSGTSTRVGSCSEDSRNSPSTRTSISSRSSSPSRQCLRDALSFVHHSSSNPLACSILANACDIIPVNFVEGITCRDTENIQPQADNDHDVDHQSPARTTVASNTTIQPAVSSAMVAEQPVEDGNSSETTSATSNILASDADAKPDRYDKLEAFIKDEVLRYDPEVADLFYEKIKGILEYASPEDIEQPQGSHELSLLRLLELEAFQLVQPGGGATEYAGSSASGTSSPPSPSNFGQAIIPSSSSSNQNGPGSSAPARDRASPNEGSSQQTKRQKTNPKSIMSQSSKARAFRCFLNALYPAIFSVNQETLEKYRTCTGPGWSSMQHVREHLQLVHTKQVKRPNALQCGVCQALFSNQDELRFHTETVDCPARCLECDEEFTSKASRLEHQRLSHGEEESEACFVELDDKKWKKIKDAIKDFNAYSDALKKGRGEPRVELEEWIKANTTLYEAGRSEKAKARSKTELGHWYVTYMALSPENKILEHPFYDYATIPHADMAEEKILVANDFIVESRIQAHGPPPSEPGPQREWYRDALRDALRIAARTTRNVTYAQAGSSSAPMNTSLPAQGSSSNSLQRPASEFDHFASNMSGVSASPSVRSGLSGMAFSHESYLSSAQPVIAMTREPAPLLGSSMMGVGMNRGWGYSLGGVAQGDSQYQMDQMAPQYMGYENNLQGPFGPSESEILENHAFSPEWSGQAGQH